MCCTEKHFIAVPRYPGIFASKDGQIKYQGNILPQYSGNAHGHRTITLPIPYRGLPGTRIARYVHMFVALAHVPNPCPGVFKVIDHIDRDPGHNHASNLRWLTQQLNCMNRGEHRLAYFQKKKKWFDGRARRWRFRERWGKAFMEKNKHGPDTQGYWEALCTVQGKKKYLGYFKTYLEAHRTATSYRNTEFNRIYEQHINDARRAPSFILGPP
jgi:hypothetical protein